MRETMPRKLRKIANVAAVSFMMAAPSAVMAAKPKPPPPPPPPPPAPPAPIELNNQFFDWTVNATLSPPSSYVQSPFLTDANAATVNAFLQSLPAGSIRAVKIQGPLTNATTNLIFNNANYNVSYVLADIEDQTNSVQITNLANQVRWVNGMSGGTQTKSSRAYVSNFGYSADAGGSSDPTHPGSYGTTKGTHSFAGWKRADYDSACLNMSAAELYPGSPSFRNPAAGNSSAPNIRSALFTLPAWRLGRVSDAIIKTGLATHRNVPWITNFNNWMNPAFNNAPGTLGYSYFWTNPTHDQMLSSRDFATLVAHYRLRGANSFALFQSGVIGVSQATLEAQAKEGWTESHINAVMSAADKRLLIGNEMLYSGTADANTTIIEDGVSKNIEQAGAMFSGVYSLSQGKLDILLSNMDQGSHKLTLPSTIGGYALNTKDFTLAGGTHLLVEYSKVKSGKSYVWNTAVASQFTPFTDLDNDRSKQGVPEPGMLSLMAVVGVFGMTRRRRATDAA